MSSFDVDSICWVKCGAIYWPAQVVDQESLDEEVKESIKNEKKKVEIVLKFFNEDGYEFIHDLKTVFPYNGPRKEEFIKKGVVKSRTRANETWFAKFPKDIVLCEEITNGDPQILEKEPYAEKKEKVDYSQIFGTPEEKAKKKAKGGASGGRKRKAENDAKSTPNKRQITHPRFQGTSDHKVKIMAQPSSPYHLDLISKESKVGTSRPGSSAGSSDTGNSAGSAGNGSGGGVGKYTCPLCDFSASRLNVIILHNKTHSESGNNSAKSTPSTANRKSGGSAQTPRSRAATPKATPTSPPKRRGGRATPQAKKEPKATPTPTPRARQAKKETPKETPKKAKKDKEEEPSVATPSTTPATTPTSKKRLTKKQKEELAKEKERKEQERKKILGDWSEEEEEEEKKQMRDIMGPYVDSSDEENEVLGDDNVHNNDYEGEDEIEAEERKEREEEEKKKNLANRTVEEEKKKREEARKREEEQRRKEEEELEEAKRKAKEAEEARRKAEEEEKKKQELEKVKEAEREKAKADEYDFDIGKALEETAVPELPDILSKKKNGSPVIKSPSPQKRKVSFGAAKEFTNTKLTLVQAESNLDDPMMVDDEFDEFASFSDAAAAASAKPILKKPEVPMPAAVAVPAAVPVAANLKPEGENGNEAGQQQETYLILVDDGSGAVDNLNSQTLYIDPSQLENGNMVLMTNEGVPVSAQGVVATSAGDAANHEQILAAAMQPVVAAPNTVVEMAVAPTATTAAIEAPIVSAAVVPAPTTN